MRKEIQYQCEHCGKDVKYGSVSAVCNNVVVFCCSDCALEHYGISEVQWDEWEHVLYTPDENNGYGVYYMDDKLFTNGMYIVFDKCKLNIDDEEYMYFNRRRGIGDVGVRKLDECLVKYSSIECGIRRELSALPTLWNKEKKKMIAFILKHSGNNSGQFLSSEPDDDGVVVINTNGVKAIVQIY